MTKKQYLVLVLVTLVGFLAFGDSGEQEEVDFLLFLPNSGNQFVNEGRAMVQLDNMAAYLAARDLRPGQIAVHGYTAAVANDIDPVNLSRNRALYVITELQKRGLQADLFAEPAAYGSAELWGGSTDEADRSLNRRVRILVDDTVLSPGMLQTADIAAETPYTANPQEAAQHKSAAEQTGSRFPWWIIPLALLAIALLAAAVFLASRRKQHTTTAAASRAPASCGTPGQKIYVLTEDEIRQYAYELYQDRGGQDEDAIQDWHLSVRGLTAFYEAQGYRVLLYWEIEGYNEVTSTELAWCG